MQSIVLDTNVLVMSISARNVYHKVWQAFLQGDYTLCVSNEILEEYVEVLTRNINARVAEAVVYAILTRWNVRKLDPHYRFHLIKTDEDDNKFVDCAIAGNARYIVTEDHHFDVLKEISFPKVAVINIDDFASQF
ncbi:putative toxin-antitoxin system toxin component, PIN family [Parabacteroides sp. AD58]|uniref:Toxin-antitoxin system toxin component, PIN family n=1 Tax=Parabacteroides absconsus TaxID=2951805 RepID=A0ABZ2IGQ9_9BACT|nr:putative toxin-antitoxin system toxin component, PIN family [Parabacteroides sp. AD58]MCM6903176.1 putative toxin-antitoxin system toxin component, PIN family [Parabacteroides sp. AD58]